MAATTSVVVAKTTDTKKALDTNTGTFSVIKQSCEDIPGLEVPGGEVVLIKPQKKHAIFEQINFILINAHQHATGIPRIENLRIYFHSETVGESLLTSLKIPTKKDKTGFLLSTESIQQNQLLPLMKWFEQNLPFSNGMKEDDQAAQDFLQLLLDPKAYCKRLSHFNLAISHLEEFAKGDFEEALFKYRAANQKKYEKNLLKDREETYAVYFNGFSKDLHQLSSFSQSEFLMLSNWHMIGFGGTREHSQHYSAQEKERVRSESELPLHLMRELRLTNMELAFEKSKTKQLEVQQNRLTRKLETMEAEMSKKFAAMEAEIARLNANQSQQSAGAQPNAAAAPAMLSKFKSQLGTPMAADSASAAVPLQSSQALAASAVSVAAPTTTTGETAQPTPASKAKK